MLDPFLEEMVEPLMCAIAAKVRRKDLDTGQAAVRNESKVGFTVKHRFTRIWYPKDHWKSPLGGSSHLVGS